MSEEKNLVINANDSLGEIVIAPEVIEVIIGIAASKVEGVYGMRGTFANNVNELLGRAAHGKGVYLRTEEEALKSRYLLLLELRCFCTKSCVRNARPCETTSLIYDRY